MQLNIQQKKKKQTAFSATYRSRMIFCRLLSRLFIFLGSKQYGPRSDYGVRRIRVYSICFYKNPASGLKARYKYFSKTACQIMTKFYIGSSGEIQLFLPNGLSDHDEILYQVFR